jgi:imidazoleglycerol phosphate dehydratase HisB
LKLEARSATISRKTNETDIYINLNLDGTGKSKMKPEFLTMLDQIARHGQMDLEILVEILKWMNITLLKIQQLRLEKFCESIRK